MGPSIDAFSPLISAICIMFILSVICVRKVSIWKVFALNLSRSSSLIFMIWSTPIGYSEFPLKSSRMLAPSFPVVHVTP